MLLLTQMSLGAKSWESENESFEEITPKAENSRFSVSQREELGPSAFLGISSGSKKGFLMWEVPGNAPAPQLFFLWFCAACLTWWLSAEPLWWHLAANVIFCCLDSGADPSLPQRQLGSLLYPPSSASACPLSCPPLLLQWPSERTTQQNCLKFNLNFFLLSVLQFSFHLPKAETLSWLLR